MNFTQRENLRLFASLSVSNNNVILDDINYIVDMYFLFGGGWTFNMDKLLPFNGLSITPGVGYGWMPHLAEGGYWTNGNNQVHFFQDQIFLFQVELAYSLKNLLPKTDLTVVLTPSYVHFAEVEYDGQEVGFNIGLRYPLSGKLSNRTQVTPTKIEKPKLEESDSISPEVLDKSINFEILSPSSVKLDFKPATDNKTPESEIRYRTLMLSEPDFTIDTATNYTEESIGTPSITVDKLSPGETYYAYTFAVDNYDNYTLYDKISFTLPNLFDGSGFNLGENAIEVDLRKVLEVEFNTDIKEATINNDTVYVISGEKRIRGEVKYKDRILTFKPLEDFLQGKEHDFVLTTGIEDLYGNTLKEDARFTFKALDYNDIFAHWKFDYNTYDSSGNNHTAELKSVKTERKPEFMDIDEFGNGGLHFVGGYNWGTYIDLGTINMGDKFTIAGWMKIEEPPAEYSQKIMTMISNGDAGAKKDGFKVFFNNWSKDDKRIVIETGNGTSYRNSETQDDFIAYNNWYHVAVVIDRTIGVVKLYFNGKEAETTNNGAIMNDFNTNAPLHIGHFKDGYYHYNGYIDDFRIYKKVISASDIEIISRSK